VGNRGWASELFDEETDGLSGKERGYTMEQEQAKTIAALEYAIQMEIDGKEYYQKARRSSGNGAGRELFEWLAGEEDKHRQKFQEIYEAVKSQKAWPRIALEPVSGQKLRTVYSRAMEAAAAGAKASSGETDAVTKAMEMENKTREFYKAQGKDARYEAEKSFYEALAAEEQGHYVALADYREYLIDPAGWFRKAEHHSLDGG